jgi:uncharacterized membrane protein YqjE
MGDHEQNHQTGIFASLRRTCDTALAAVYNRVELVAVEVQEEKERLIQLFVLAAVVVFLGNMAVLMLTATIIYLAGPQARGPLLIALTILYLSAAVAGYVALRKKLCSSPRVFDDTLAELKKDRDWLLHRK